MPDKPNTVAVTGTNGKTTTLKILENIFKVNNFKGHYKSFSSRITEKPSLLKKINEAYQKGADCAFLELSSKALSGYHLKSINFDLAVITNLSTISSNSSDNVQRSFGILTNFYKRLGQNSISLINADDPLALQLADFTQGEVITYALGYPNAMVTAKNVELNQKSSRFEMVINSYLLTPKGKVVSPSAYNFFLPLPGKHNVYNGMVAALMAIFCGLDCKLIARGFSTVQPVKRNLELIYNNCFSIIDDCADNPGALQSVFDTIRYYNFRNIIIVFSLQNNHNLKVCRLNGELIAKWARKLPLKEVIVTKSIYQVNKKNRINLWEEKAFLEKCKETRCRLSVIPDLADALQAAVSSAEERDLILLLGKKGMEAGASLSEKIIQSFSGSSG